MAYRVELSKSNRAGCSAVECKKEGVKIVKGDLRQGVMVTIKEQQSWKFRHWGCVTPKVLANWAQTCEMDMELVDGYDELPEAAQQKVKRALTQGHVDDDDWNGDLECNRPGANGMFVKTPKKESASKEDEAENEASPTKKGTSKKRGKTEQGADDADEEEPPAKKARGKKGKKAAAELEEPEPELSPKPATKKATRKKGKGAPADEEDAEPPLEVLPNKGKAKKGKKAIADELLEEDRPEEVPAAKKPSKGKKADVDAQLTSLDGTAESRDKAPAKRGRKPKTPNDEDVIAPLTKARGRKKKAATKDD